MSKFMKAALLASLVGALSGGSAQAGLAKWGGVKDFSFEIERSNFGKSMNFVFAPKSGKYEFERLDGGPIKMRLKGKGVRRSWIDEYGIHVGKNDQGPVISSNGFNKGHWKKFDKKVSLEPKRSLFKSYEAEALKYCKKHGKLTEKVIGELKIPFTGWLNANGKNGPWLGERPPSWIKKTVYYTAGIVCLPEPFEVKDVDVSVKYEGGRKCPKKATLKIKFTTNKPGKNKIDFMLALGDGTTQWNSAETFGSGQNSIAVWHRNYTFRQSVNRKYMVIVKGSPISSDWVPMVVNCGGGIGGFQAAPSPHDN